MTAPGARTDGSRRALLRAAAAILFVAAAVVALLLVTETVSRPGLNAADSGVAPSGPGDGAGRYVEAGVTVPTGGPLQAVPHSFLGFSTEYWTLPYDEHYIALYKRVLRQVHVSGDTRFVLRIGGDSSDHAFWDPARRPLPHWAFEVTPSWLTQTAAVVRQMHLRVIIDLNTITSTPRLAADWADVAEDRLPRGSIIGFEIGNEPDLYDRRLWAYGLGASTFDAGVLPKTITPASYVATYSAYAHALATVVPDVPLLGPALANPHRDVGWISALLAHAHPRLGEITIHKYPYTACSRPGRPAFPTINKLLSEHASAGAAQTIRPAVAVGHLAGLPVRLTELNSIGCGGVAGVSNTFATALWAADSLFELLRAGVVGVDVHVRWYSINTPFVFDVRGVQARPLLYGLILFRRMLGPNSWMVATHLHNPQSVNVHAWAVRVGADKLHVLLIDKGFRSVAVRLRLPATAPGYVQRLLAPTAASRSGVTLGGQYLSQSVTWRGRPVMTPNNPRGGYYLVRVRRQSAAMLTVPLSRGALAG